MDDFPAPGALPDPLPARSRGNGLPGKHFVPLLAVDARMTGDVLDALATASIAAYARPRTAMTDEVYSDAARRADARLLLAACLPDVLPAPSAADGSTGPDGTDGTAEAEATDAAFAEIVARWDAPVEPPSRLAATPPPPPAQVPVDTVETDDTVNTDDTDGDHYIPPPAAPLPRLAPITRWALIGIFAGVLALVLPLMIGLHAPAWTCAAAVAAIIGGGAVMVARMGNEPHDGDDGAVV